MKTPEELTDLLIDAAVKDGGVTLNREGKAMTRGLAVAVDPKHECIAANLFRPAVLSWVRRKMHLLVENSFYCIGAWLDSESGDFYLDVVDVLPDVQLERVLTLAKERKQCHIFHLTTSTLLRIE